MPPKRQVPLAEETPRLDVQRLLSDLHDAGKQRVVGMLRIKFGLRIRYLADLSRGEIHLQIEDLPRWRYQIIGRGVRCNTCQRYTEILYWVPQRADASEGEGRCAVCCRVRWMGGYLTGSRAHTGRLQPQLRKELQAGNVAGVLKAMARGPRQWLAGRQALEDEEMLPRKYTLENGNARRWRWKRK